MRLVVELEAGVAIAIGFARMDYGFGTITRTSTLPITEKRLFALSWPN
jgi:hypothetical protein